VQVPLLWYEGFCLQQYEQALVMTVAVPREDQAIESLMATAPRAE
jgi:hypothetical protein